MGYQSGIIQFDDKDLRRFERDLKTFGKRAYPFATKNTLNKSALQTQVEARRNISRRMTIRNTFTLREVKVVFTKSLDVRQQETVVGASLRVPYLRDQEFGGVHKPGRGGTHVAVPGTMAAGQGATGRGAAARTRPVRKPLWMKNIKLIKPRRGRSRKQRNFLAVQAAIKAKKKQVFLDIPGTPGIYAIGGTRKSPKLRRVWLLKQRSVPIPRNPWLLPATDRIITRMPRIYRKELKQQLTRHRLFKGRG
jgi:hypothetical protein